MLLEMQQETSGRVRGSGQAVSCPVQFGLDAGKGKKQTDLSAFSWGGGKKNKNKKILKVCPWKRFQKVHRDGKKQPFPLEGKLSHTDVA